MKKSLELAKRIRISTLKMIFNSQASHIGSCFSAVDIMASLYSGWLNIKPSDPLYPQRDRFILSKGHAAAALYSCLGEIGFFNKDLLAEYCKDGGALPGHVTHGQIPGIEISTGSLGHGLAIGAGMALGAKQSSEKWRTVVFLSDGELNEGSIWETVLFAPAHQLDNLIIIIDYNKFQSYGRISDILPLEPLAKKLQAFNWTVKEIDGHNHRQIETTLGEIPFAKNSPSAIIAHTIKGKGVSFMEDCLLWHYKSPNETEFNLALAEISNS